MNNAQDLLGIPLFAWYPILAIGFFLLMVTLVPRRHIRDLFLDSVIMGVALSWVFALITQGLGLLHYEHLGPFHLADGPIWLHLAWASAVIIFLYFKPPLEKPLLLWAYILGFSLMSAMLDATLHQMGLLRYIHWSPLARLIVVVPWFWAASWFNAHYVQGHMAHTGKDK